MISVIRPMPYPIINWSIIYVIKKYVFNLHEPPMTTMKKIVNGTERTMRGRRFWNNIKSWRKKRAKSHWKIKNIVWTQLLIFENYLLFVLTCIASITRNLLCIASVRSDSFTSREERAFILIFNIDKKDCNYLSTPLDAKRECSVGDDVGGNDALDSEV